MRTHTLDSVNLGHTLDIVDSGHTLDIVDSGSYTRPVQSNPTSTSKLALCDMDVEFSADIDVPGGYYTGVTVMLDGRIVLVDNNNSKAILLDRHLVVQSTLALTSKPWDVAADGVRDVIVSMHGSRQLQWLSVTSELHIGRTIPTQLDQTRGIAVHGGYIYLSGYTGKSGGGGHVQVLDRDGPVVRRIAVDSTGTGVLRLPLYVAVSARGDVYVADYFAGRIACYTNGGDEVYNATPRDMGKPNGMVVDGDCLIVCCHVSNNIQVLGRDVARRKVMLSSADGLTGPIALAYRKTDNTLIVTMGGTPNVRIYKLNDFYTGNIKYQPSTSLTRVLTDAYRLGTLGIDRTPTASVDILAIDRTPTAGVDILAIDRTPTADVDRVAIDRTQTANVDRLAIDRTPTASVDILTVDHTPTENVDRVAIDRTPTAVVDRVAIDRTPTASVDTATTIDRRQTTDVDSVVIDRTPTADVDRVAIDRTPTASVDTATNIDRTPTADVDTTITTAGLVRPGSDRKSWCDMNVESSTDIDVPGSYYSGVAVMPKGRIILVDNINSKAILLDRHLIVQSTLALPRQPWDVAADGVRDVIVSMHGGRRLQWLSVTSELHIGRTIPTQLDHIRGLAVHGGYIYLSGYTVMSGGDGQVQVLDRDGTVVRRIAVDSTGTGVLTSPLYVAVSARGDVYVADYDTGSIACYNNGGDEVYNVTPRDMGKPNGMVVDGDCLIVCCHVSNNIQVLGRDGARRRVMLSSADGLTGPIAVAYRQTDNTLIVTMGGTPNVRMYKLNDAYTGNIKYQPSTSLTRVLKDLDRLGALALDRTPTASVDILATNRTPTAGVCISAIDRTPTADADIVAIDHTPTADVDRLAIDRTPTASVDTATTIDRTATADVDKMAIDRTPTADVDRVAIDLTPTEGVDTLAIDHTPMANVDIVAIDRTQTVDVDRVDIDRTPPADVDRVAINRTPAASVVTATTINRTPTADVDRVAIDRTPTADVGRVVIDRTPTVDVDRVAIDRTPAGSVDTATTIDRTSTADVDRVAIDRTPAADVDTATTIDRTPAADVDRVVIDRTPTASVDTSTTIDRTPTADVDTTITTAGLVRPGSDLKSWCDMDVESSADIDVPGGYYSGVAVMPDGRIVLVDNINSKAILLDRHLAVQSTLALPRQLWDVAADGVRDVIVSNRYSRRLQWLGVTSGLHIGRTIPTQLDHIRGLAVLGGYIYLSGYTGKSGGDGQVQVLDRDGTVVRRIAVASTGTDVLTSPLYVAVSARGDVYVADHYAGRIACYSNGGDEVYYVTSRDMGKPRGLVVGGDCLIVCCQGSNNIHVLRRDGARRKVMLSSADGVARPIVVAYRQTDNMLIVTMVSTPNVRIYKLK